MAACCRAPQSRTRCVPTSVNERASELSMASCNGVTSSTCMLTPCESTGAMPSGSMSGHDCKECMRMHAVPACAQPGMAGAGHFAALQAPQNSTRNARRPYRCCSALRMARSGGCRARTSSSQSARRCRSLHTCRCGIQVVGHKSEAVAACCPEQQFCDAVELSYAEEKTVIRVK